MQETASAGNQLVVFSNLKLALLKIQAKAILFLFLVLVLPENFMIHNGFYLLSIYYYYIYVNKVRFIEIIEFMNLQNSSSIDMRIRIFQVL